MSAGPAVAVPGKLFLAGEYAVLEGAPAVLAAAGRRATAAFVPGAAPASAVVARATEAAAAALAERGRTLPAGAARVDTSAFMHAGTKLGLGSSAAAAVAAVAAALEHGGLAIAEHRALLAALADAAHRAAQGGVGSGADVAVAVEGGFLGFVRPRDAAPHLTPLGAPPDLHLVPFWTRAAARTPDFIAGVRRLAESDPAVYGWRLAALTTAAEAFRAAFASSAAATVAAAAVYGEALAALGKDASLPIVTAPVADAAALAAALGGAAKPSGAGGGDMGIGFFHEKPAADAFVARCPEGVLVLDIALGVAGAARIEPAAQQ